MAWEVPLQLMQSLSHSAIIHVSQIVTNRIMVETKGDKVKTMNIIAAACAGKKVHLGLKQCWAVKKNPSSHFQIVLVWMKVLVNQSVEN